MILVKNMNVLKRTGLLVMIAITMLLNSCVGGEGFLWHSLYDDDGSKAEARLEQVIEAIEKKDRELLTTMFSETALSEAEDFDDRLDYLFEFVGDNITSWEKIVAGATSESISKGKRKKKSRSWFTVATEEGEYLFFLLEYPTDTEHPENVGMYMLQVIKAENRETQFDGGNEILCAGIWLPEEAMQ